VDLIRDLLRAIEAHPVAAAGAAVGSFVLSIVAAMIVIVRLPADYFVGAAPRPILQVRSRALAVLLRIARNGIGVVLLALGAVMSVPGVPGQGILTMLLGLMLVDVPGKRRLERRLVARPAVRRALDRMRARWHRPPLEVDRPPREVDRS
jgi:hypothetical protein